MLLGKQQNRISKDDSVDDENEGNSSSTLNLVYHGLQPMSIGSSSGATGVKEDPFLHPCLRAIRRVCDIMIHHLNTIVSCGCWSTDDDNDEDPFYHGLTPESTIMEHCQKLTRWSRTLCAGLVFIALATSILSSLWELVLFLTVQYVVILYTIYWRNHRLDLSLNRAIHYFAVGAALSMVWATLQGGLEGLLHRLYPSVSSWTTSNYEAIHVQFASTYPYHMFWTCVRAFVVVGAWEEYLKYQGFVMIAQQQQSGPARRSQNWEDCEALMASTTTTQSSAAPSCVSSGAAITCAVIAVGAGFGWVNNFALLYRDEKLSTSSTERLAGKLSILPMHTLLAAVQSTGICCRDLEGKSGSLMLLPAMLLHGCFAFFLLKLTDNEDEANLVGGRNQLVAVWMTVILTFAYYVYFAGRQRTRLQAMDDTPDVLDIDDAQKEDQSHAQTRSADGDDVRNLDC